VGIIHGFYAKNNMEISVKGELFLIKGVNRQVVEITQTQCEYFERVLFFIKPEYSAVSEGDLRERASIIAQSAGMPPATGLKKTKLRFILSMSAAACGGAVVSGAIFLMTSFF
jgi:hypothetical protein